MTNHHENRSLRRIRPLRSLLTACAAALLALSATAQERDYVQYVNTLQGTDSHFGLSYGNTFATTAMPYAMHTWSAQTGPNGEGWKYQYFVDRIRGFQQAHQCSPWMSDYAVYSLMPEVGELVLDEDTRGAKFSHDNEVAKPHYYKVTFDNGITTEMAPTTRGVHLRFSFPRKGGAAYLVLDGYTAQSEVKIDPERREISGWVNNHRFVNHPETFRSYFVIRFDRPFEAWGTWENRRNTRTDGQTEAAGDGCGAYIRFKAGTKVQAKAAESASHLITMGEMASSLAHELNQPLAAVQNYASATLTMMKKGLSEARVVEALNKIINQTQRAAYIIRRIRSFAKAKGGEANITAASVEKIVSGAMELALLQAQHFGMKINVRIEKPEHEIVCDVVMIEQVLLNLLKNAMEASQTTDSDSVDLSVTCTEKHTIFEVADHGCGMPV